MGGNHIYRAGRFRSGLRQVDIESLAEEDNRLAAGRQRRHPVGEIAERVDQHTGSERGKCAAASSCPEAVHGGVQTRPIVRERLPRALGDDVDDGGEVVRPHPIDDLPRVGRHAQCSVGRHLYVVQDDHEDRPLVQIGVRPRFARGLAEPGGAGSDDVGEIDSREGIDLLRPAVLENGEVGRGQSANRQAVATKDADIENDGLDAGSESRGWLLGEWGSAQDENGGSKAENAGASERRRVPQHAQFYRVWCIVALANSRPVDHPIDRPVQSQKNHGLAKVWFWPPVRAVNAF